LPTLSEARSTLAIRCEGIGKRYRIGQQEPYRTLRDTIANAARAPFRQLTAALKGESQTAAEKAHLWALKDLSLEIQHGEVVGIIGRNGSGKSTLLKILSQITRPTKGLAEIRGRVGTLLEVGAGFHPELTGRENIYLNGTILGMARREIDRKFDEIVEFSECSRMLDTPLKHYSSGMYVRLAFAVAAHLETEILIVDEVLAVGDAAFQKKCLGKIGDVAHAGRTVLFVSHNMLAVDSLCTRAICLHDGRMVFEGTPATVTSRYLQEWLPTMNEVAYDDIETAPGNEHIRLHGARVRLGDRSAKGQITVRTPLAVEFEYWKLKASSCLDLVAEVSNEHGIVVFATGKLGAPAAPQGLLRGSFIIPADLLNNGTYRINLYVLRDGTDNIAEWTDLLAFEVHDAASELRGPYYDYWPGAVRPNLEWKTEFIGSVDKGPLQEMESPCSLH
jgi:lipopolysaccharide transport system ATP-binding protein